MIQDPFDSNCWQSSFHSSSAWEIWKLKAQIYMTSWVPPILGKEDQGEAQNINYWLSQGKYKS